MYNEMRITFLHGEQYNMSLCHCELTKRFLHKGENITQGGHSHMEVTGMYGQDPQSRGLLVADWIKKGVFQWGHKQNRGHLVRTIKKKVVF